MSNLFKVPTFQTLAEYISFRADISFWWPYITHVLEHHKLIQYARLEQVECGFNPTYPVFLIENMVIKFFGHCTFWQSAYETERLSHDYLKQDNTILVPRILAKGKLFPNNAISWPYIISSRVQGESWSDSHLTAERKAMLALEIGREIKKIHRLPVDTKLQHDQKWPTLNFRLAAQKSVLPTHLVAQVDKYILTLDNFDRCFVNGDIVDSHVFINEGCLSGIIDWGDATVTDRHYELGKLLDTFDWDKALLKIFLDASEWPVKKNFPKQCLGLALFRQAVGLTQHSSFDVFYKLPHLLPLNDIVTLEELADILFEV